MNHSHSPSNPGHSLPLPLTWEAREALHREARALRGQAIGDAGVALGRALRAGWVRLQRGLALKASAGGVMAHSARGVLAHSARGVLAQSAQSALTQGAQAH